MTDTPEVDLGPLFDANCEVYCIKLMTGETILAKSTDDTDLINDKANIEVFGAMKFEAFDEMNEVGKVSRVQLLAPWIQGAAIDALLPIPLDMVVQIVPCKPSIKFQYQNVLMSQLIKDQVAEERFKIIRAEMERRQAEVADGITNKLEGKENTESKTEQPSFYVTTVPEREPDRVDAEELYSEQQEAESEEPSNEETKTYQVNGITIH